MVWWFAFLILSREILLSVIIATVRGQFLPMSVISSVSKALTMYEFMYVYVCVYVCNYVCLYVNVCIYVCMCMYICMYVFRLFRLSFFGRLSVPLQSQTSVYEHFLLFVYNFMCLVNYCSLSAVVTWRKEWLSVLQLCGGATWRAFVRAVSSATLRG